MIKFPGLPALGLLLLLGPLGLQAQFTFNYPGPNIIAVGPTCSSNLAGKLGTPVVTSSAGPVIISQFDSVASGFGLWTRQWSPPETAIVNWFVQDAMGNSNTFIFAINFADQTPPQFDLSGVDIVINVNSVIQVPPIPVIPVDDNCTLTPKLNTSFVETPRPDICKSGTFTRTWRATDEAGNTGVFTQTINVFADTLPPQIINAPQNGSAPCSQLATAYPAWLAAQMANFWAEDSSTPVIYSNTGPATFPPGCAAPLTVIFRATDQCGLRSSRTATFATSDTKPPYIVRAPQDSVAACSPSGNQIAALGNWIQRRAGLIARDSCSADSEQKVDMFINGIPRDSAQVAAAFLASFADGCGPQIINGLTVNKVRAKVSVDFFVKDPCNNQTYAGKATYAAIDTLPPVISGTALTFEECGGGNDQQALINWINNFGGAGWTDDCSSATWTNFSWATSGGQSGNGAFTTGPYPQIEANNCQWFVDVTFRATDDCGNTGSRSLRWRIRDTQAPVLSGFPAVSTLFCPQPFPTFFGGTVNDNCDAAPAVTYSYKFSDTLCTGNYTLNVTWAATDDCGNTGTAVQTFLIRDTEPPAFSLVPAGITAGCENYAGLPLPVLGAELQATDACGALDTILISQISAQNPNPGVCGHYTFTITRIFTARDKCGNTATATQLVNVTDNIPPAFSGFLDTTAVCEVQPVMPPPALTDNCSGVASGPTLLSTDITAGTCDDSYTITLKWQALDVCGNLGLFNQDILVQDTVKPTLSGVPVHTTAGCNAIPPPPALNLIVGNDNCDESVSIAFNESMIQDTNPANCAHWTNYLIRREWTATDNCGNARTYTQNIQVLDNEGPLMVMPATIARPSDPGICGAEIIPPSPLSIYDECTALGGATVLRDTALLLSTSGQPLVSATIDTIVFSWSAPNIPPFTPVVDTAQLRIFLDNADAEGDTEYLSVYGEDGVFLGRTANSAVSCGNSDTSFLIPPNLLNAWLTDGMLEITLVPSGSGTAALNPFCSGGRARAEISYSTASQQVPLTVAFSIDGGPQQPYPTANNYFLSIGSHVITYTATDCSGNSSTAAIPIQVIDAEPPILVTSPPATSYVEPGNCLANVVLPFPGITENCGLSGLYSDTTDVINVQFENDLNAGIVPKDIILTFSGAIPNAVTGGTLRIRHKGDNAQTGEFFNVWGEGSVFLSATTYGPSGTQCFAFHETVIPVNAVQMNNWAADGQVTIRLEANRDVLNFSDFISPCAALQPNGTDPVSAVQAILEYDYGVIHYEIFRNNINGTLINSGALFGNQTELALPPAGYVARYTVNDASGTNGISTFPFQVRDTIRPTALCINRTILVNASGELSYTLNPAEINNGSFDNCSTVSLQANPATFTCNQAGSLYPVTLTVTDSSGNSSTCQAMVRVETAPFTPSYLQICVGDTLRLLANPPVTPGGNSVYTYLWNGPNGFVSNQENPVIPNTLLFGSGIYSVTVTGLSLCTAVGVVQVDLINLPTLPTVSGSNVCFGQNLVLSTPAFSGAGVQYRWFAGTPPNGTPIATTTQPTYTVIAPGVGIYQYYVQVQGNGCASQPSQAATVEVNSVPEATVVQPLINLCECQPLSFGTTIQGPGISYFWTGPNGFQSTLQYPPVDPCVSLADTGTYFLTIFKNGCPSAPASVKVSVRPKPPTPQISGAGAFCAGATIQLTAGVPTAAQYIWTAPDFSTDTTGLNSLTLPNISPADSGFWQVAIVQLGCASSPSPPVLVRVEAYPQVSAEANTPLCQGEALQLMASANQSPLNYAWTGPNGFSSFQQNPSPLPVPGNYIVTASTPLANCSKKDTVTVVVATPPLITAATSDAPLCSDGTLTVTFFATVVTNYPPLTYQWQGPGFTSSLANPTIPSATSAKNGIYTLTVLDSFGCISAPVDVLLNIRDVPPRPIIAPPTAVCAGANVTLLIANAANYASGNYTYIWHLPNNSTQTTTVPLLALPATTLQSGGMYSVEVATDTCTSQLSVPVQLTIHPIPPPPAVVANPNPVCAGSTLQLSVPFNPNTQYTWNGPMGFSASIHNPTIIQIDTAQTGNYYCRISQNDCLSSIGEGIFIQVKPRPTKPVLIPATAVCLQQNDTLQLQVSQGFTTPLAQYTWLNSLNDTLAGPQLSPLVRIANLSDLPPGPNTIFAVANLDGCNSLPSATITIQADTIPDDTAFAGNDRPACAAQPLSLNATPAIPGASGRWTQVGSPTTTINTPSQPATQVGGLQAGNVYQYAWTLSNGACENYSADTVAIQSVAFEQAAAIDLIDTCFAKSIQLSATPGTATTGAWTQSMGQQILGVAIENPLDPNTLISNLEPGNTYFFIWTLADIGCGPSRDTVTVRNIGSVAFAGIDKTICDEDYCALIEAAPLPDLEFGVWTSPNPNLVFASPTNRVTTVCGLEVGPNILYWTTNGGVCGNLSRDTLVLNYELTPIVRQDTVIVPFGFKKNFSVLLNDILPQQYRLEIVDLPDQGRLETTTEEGRFDYQPDIGFAGSDYMLYQVCNLNCTDACNTGQVVFIVEEALDCEVPTVITPNGDGVNDVFFVPCLSVDADLDNEVSIFNQWGDEVFHAQPYDNNWEGNFNGEPLPAGTYFFVVKFNGNAGIKTGFLIIQR